MKILYYDCFAGISGDMHLGAMLDIGVDKNYLLAQLAKLGLSGYELEITKERRQGIEGTRVNVNISDDKEYKACRNLQDIKTIIRNSTLSEVVKQKSSNMFERLAAVEAKIHGKSIDEIHFHEVGAVDSIVDIVGAAICLEALQVDKVICSPVEVGSGFVECAHGSFPVPAPATMELLKNIPITTGKVEFEATTPTGAVILVLTVNEFSKEFAMTPEKIGYGLGSRDTKIPNVLRVCLADQETKSASSEAALIVECNMDDMNPEFYSYLIDKLLANGAKDVFITPIIMKKTRPASKLTVLCTKTEEAKVKEILLAETTTLGLRQYAVERTILERQVSIIQTQYGDVRVKTALLDKQPIKWKAEYEDCLKIATENNIPIQTVYDDVNRILLKQNH